MCSPEHVFLSQSIRLFAYCAVPCSFGTGTAVWNCRPVLAWRIIAVTAFEHKAVCMWLHQRHMELQGLVQSHYIVILPWKARNRLQLLALNPNLILI